MNTEFRKKSSGVVVSTNPNSLHQARRIKLKREKEENRMVNIENSIIDLNKKLDVILSFIKNINNTE